jgi:hypothetical protein
MLVLPTPLGIVHERHQILQGHGQYRGLLAPQPGSESDHCRDEEIAFLHGVSPRLIKRLGIAASALNALSAQVHARADGGSGHESPSLACYCAPSGETAAPGRVAVVRDYTFPGQQAEQ